MGGGVRTPPAPAKVTLLVVSANSLIVVWLQKLPMKDFAAEIRAHLDVEQFLSQAQLMLDVHETNVESILDAMLHQQQSGTVRNIWERSETV